MARLEPEQLELAVEAAIDAGAAGLQTGNGFGPACRTDQIRQLKQLIRKRCAIKAAGGIHSLSHAGDLLVAGGDLLVTSSAPTLLQAQRRPAA